MLDEYSDVLVSAEVMEILNIKKEQLYELIRTKKLPAYKIGKKEWRFNKVTLINHLLALEQTLAK